MRREDIQGLVAAALFALFVGGCGWLQIIHLNNVVAELAAEE